MVAAAEPKAVELDKPQPIQRPNSSADMRTFALVRTLYLVQGHTPTEIEAMGLGVTKQQVSNWANRNEWAKQKARARENAENSTRARMDESISRVAEAIAVESEELCFKSLTQTRAGLDKGGLEGAKQAQAASSTLRNLAGVAKMLRETGSTQDGDGQTLNMNLFFCAPSPAAKAEAKQVAEQVTEVEAKSV